MSAASREGSSAVEVLADTARQVRVRFPDRESAIAYAEAHGIDFQVMEPKTRRVRPRAYADNFAFTRNGAWTH